MNENILRDYSERHERLLNLYRVNLARNAKRAAERTAQIGEELAEANAAADEEFSRACKDLTELAISAERERECAERVQRETERAHRDYMQANDMARVEAENEIARLRAKLGHDAAK